MSSLVSPLLSGGLTEDIRQQRGHKGDLAQEGEHKGGHQGGQGTGGGTPGGTSGETRDSRGDTMVDIGGDATLDYMVYAFKLVLRFQD